MRATADIKPVCPERTRGLLTAFVRSQRRAVESYDPVKAHLPSGVRAIEDIAPLCPERTRGLLPGFKRSQSRTVLSSDPVKAHLPSGVRATDLIQSGMP